MNFSTFFSAVFNLQHKTKQIILVMKLTTILLLTALCQVNASVYSQNLTLKHKNASIDAIFKSIEKQSNYVFLYDNLELQNAKRVSIDIKNASIEQVLNLCFKEQPLTYKIFDKTIVLRKLDEITETNFFETITGKITDAEGKPISGVSVSIKNSSQSTMTDANGTFTINIQAGNTLIISYIGFKSQEVAVGGQKQLRIILIEQETALDELVIVGYGKQKRINLSGAVDAISAKELENRPITSIGAGLQGLIPNLNITNASGRANDATALNIRGVTSLSGGNPYILVDNVPYT